MSNLLLRLEAAVECFLGQEAGQDLSEYALTVAMIALGSVAGMQSLASGVTLAFNSVSSSISIYLLR
jgi:Flp pilus assembly pilin Flp